MVSLTHTHTLTHISAVAVADGIEMQLFYVAFALPASVNTYVNASVCACGLYLNLIACLVAQICQEQTGGSCWPGGRGGAWDEGQHNGHTGNTKHLYNMLVRRANRTTIDHIDD